MILLFKLNSNLSPILQIMQEKLLIFHFVLEGISTAESPANTVHEFLHGFFKAIDFLIFQEVRFNFVNGCRRHTATMHKLVKDLERFALLNIN